MRGAADRQVPEILEGEGGATQREMPGKYQSADHRDHLEIHQLGRRKVLPCETAPSRLTCSIVVDQGRHEHRRVSDDHDQRGPTLPPRRM